ncbi:MAG: hypothetical protein RI933_261 [Actinomycetota bacterium]
MHKKFSLRRLFTVVFTALFAVVGSIVAIDAPAKAASFGSDSTVDYNGVFNGTSQYFSGTNFDIDQTSQSFTAEAWVRDTSTDVAGGTIGAATIRAIFSQGVEGQSANRFSFGTNVVAGDNDRREIVWAYRSTGNSAWSTGTGIFIPKNAWTHVAFVSTATAIKIYVNGQFAKEFATTDMANISTGKFNIGRGHYGDQMFWSGDIDEVRVWSGDQSANIASRMHSYVASNTAGLRAYFDFNEGSGTSVYNRVNDLALSASGAPTFRTVESISKLQGKTVVTFPRTYLTAGGGWKVPAGVNYVDVFLVGGGAGGGGGGAGNGTTHVGGGGGGGGAGQAITSLVTEIQPETVKTVKVGHGGQGGNPGITATSWGGDGGKSGGQSSFGALNAAPGFGGWGAGFNDGLLNTGRSAAGWTNYFPEVSGYTPVPYYQDQNGGTGGQSGSFRGQPGHGTASGTPGAGGGGSGATGQGTQATSASASGQGGPGARFLGTTYATGGSGGLANNAAAAVADETVAGNGGDGGNGINAGTASPGGSGASGVVIIAYAQVDDTAYDFAVNTESRYVATNKQVIPSKASFTFETWIKPDAFGADNQWRDIFRQQFDNLNYRSFGVGLYGKTIQVIHGLASTNESVFNSQSSTSDSIKLSQLAWTHLAVTSTYTTSGSNSTSRLQVYVNGHPVYDASMTMATSSLQDLGSAQLAIGGYYSTGVDRIFDGKIDQIKVWNGALTAEEIRKSMHEYSTSGVVSTSGSTLRAHFDFNSTDTSKLVDQGPNGYDFALKSGATAPTIHNVVEPIANSKKGFKFTRSVLNAWGGWIATEGLSTGAQLLAVGGGGSGGTRHAGGGGAGELIYNSSYSLNAGAVTKVQIGQGGLGREGGRNRSENTLSVAGLQGQATVVGNVEALGGGGGEGGTKPATSGGSSGGLDFIGTVVAVGSGSGYQNTGAQGTYINSNTGIAGGGGGGAGSAGYLGTNSAGGAGGDGREYSISGSPVCYAAGGGGGVADATAAGGPAGDGCANAPATGGSGSSKAAAFSATPNTGSGGGGGGFDYTDSNEEQNSGSGGSGVVIIATSAKTADASVAGNYKLDETLTATAATYSSTVSSTSFKWQRADSLNGSYADIASATSGTYKLVCADIGKYVRLANTATFGDSTTETTYTTGVKVTSAVVQAGLLMHFDAACPGSNPTTSWSDLSGQGNNMTFATNAPTRSTADGSSYAFNSASSQYGYLGAKTFNFTNGFSASFWTNFGTRENWERVFDFGNGEVNDNMWIGRIYGTNHIGMEIINNSSTVGRCVAEDAIVDNQWAHFTFVIKADKSCLIYKNGVELARSTNTTHTILAASSFDLPNGDTRTNTYFGRSNWADPYLGGGIGDFAMYNAALSASDVSANYNAQRYAAGLLTGSASISYPNSNNATYSPDGTVTPTYSRSGDGLVSFATTAANTICVVNSSSGVITIKGAGSCPVTMTVAAGTTHDATTASATLTISKASQATLTVSAAASMNYLANQTLTSTGGSGTGAVAFSRDSGTCSISGAIVTATQAGTCVVKATKLGDSNYLVAESATVTITINKINQAALTITSATTITFGQTLTLNAAGGSGPQSISYALVTPGVCSLNAGVISTTGAGSCVVKATNAASTNYNSVDSANVTITVNKAARTASFTSNVPPTPVAGGTYNVTGTLSGGSGSPTFSIASASNSVCSISGSTVTFNTSGNCVVEASKAEDANYLAASVVTQTIAVGSRNQTISFSELSNKTFGDPAFALSATASSGAAVTYSEGSSTNDACDVTSSGLVTVKAIGTCVVRANQSGNSTWAAASQVVRTFEVLADLPGVPFITSISAGDRSMTATFYAPGYTGGDTIAAYELVAVTDAPGVNVSNSACSTTAANGVLTCTVTGLANGTSYKLKVAAINSAGRGEFTTLSAAQTAVTSPEAVGSFTAVANNTALNLTWTTPISFGGGNWDSYRIYVRQAGGSYPAANAPSFTINGSNGTSTTTGWQLTGLVNGTAYDVRIVTVTTANSQALESNTAEVRQTPRTVPAAPPVVSALEVGADLVITWSPPTNDGGDPVSGYVVEIDGTPCTVNGTTCVVAAPTTPGDYDIEVKAQNAAGTSPAATTTFTRASSSGNGTNGSNNGSNSNGNSGLNNPKGLGVQTGVKPPKAIAIDKKTLVHVDAGKVTITGENLADVNEIKIGGRSAKIISKSDGALVIEMPKQTIGSHDIEIANPTGATLIENALQAVKGKYTLLRTRVSAPPAKEVSTSEKVLVANRIGVAKYATVITCAGRVSKAKEVCDFAKSVNPDLQTRILPRLWVGEDAYLVRTVLWN